MGFEDKIKNFIPKNNMDTNTQKPGGEGNNMVQFPPKEFSVEEYEKKVGASGIEISFEAKKTIGALIKEFYETRYAEQKKMDEILAYINQVLNPQPTKNIEKTENPTPEKRAQ